MTRILDATDLKMLTQLGNALDSYTTAKQAAVAAKIDQLRADRAYEDATTSARTLARSQLATQLRDDPTRKMLADEQKDHVAQVVIELTRTEADASYAAEEKYLQADAELSCAREALKCNHAQISVWVGAANTH